MRSLRVLHGYLFTVIGIAIGVAGLVALGAMSERIVRFIEGGDRFVLGQISVAGRGLGMGTGFTAGWALPRSALPLLRRVPRPPGRPAQARLAPPPPPPPFLTVTPEPGPSLAPCP